MGPLTSFDSLRDHRPADEGKRWRRPRRIREGDLAEHEEAVALKTPLIIPTGVLLGPEGLRGPVGGKIAASREKTVPLARILREETRVRPALQEANGRRRAGLPREKAGGATPLLDTLRTCFGCRRQLGSAHGYTACWDYYGQHLGLGDHAACRRTTRRVGHCL